MIIVLFLVDLVFERWRPCLWLCRRGDKSWEWRFLDHFVDWLFRHRSWARVFDFCVCIERRWCSVRIAHFQNGLRLHRDRSCVVVGWVWIELDRGLEVGIGLVFPIWSCSRDGTRTFWDGGWVCWVVSRWVSWCWTVSWECHTSGSRLRFFLLAWIVWMSRSEWLHFVGCFRLVSTA